MRELATACATTVLRACAPIESRNCSRVDDERVDGVDGGDRGGSRHVVEQRDLAEEVACAELAPRYLVEVTATVPSAMT